MSVLLIVLAVLCVLVGIAGCILPVLPGPPLSFCRIAADALERSGGVRQPFPDDLGARDARGSRCSTTCCAWLARRFGGSKQAARGSLVGLIVGMVFFPPAGLIVGAFVGAFVGELIHDGSDKLRALRVAVSSFAAFILGTGMKLAVSLAIGFYVIRALFV